MAVSLPTPEQLKAAAAEVGLALTEAEVEDLKHFHANYLSYKEEYFRLDGKWA